MLMVMPVRALIRNRIPASTQLPKFQVLIHFNCAANLGEAAVSKRNGKCSEGGGDPLSLKRVPHYKDLASTSTIGFYRDCLSYMEAFTKRSICNPQEGGPQSICTVRRLGNPTPRIRIPYDSSLV